MELKQQPHYNGTETISGIVTDFPGASNLLKEYKIDFCCGGNRPLSAALEEKNIEKSEFLARLNALYRQAAERPERDKDWRQASMSELIDHILQTHHAYLIKELPVLSDFVTKILRVHGPLHPELARLHRLYHQMKMELEQHLIEEEEVQFPLIKKAEESGSKEDMAKAAQTIGDLETEHKEVGDLLKEMREITDDYRLPEGACKTYALTFQKLEEMESDLFEHISLENNVLFPRVG